MISDYNSYTASHSPNHLCSFSWDMKTDFQELFARHVFLPAIDLVTSPDFINVHILAYIQVGKCCDRGQIIGGTLESNDNFAHDYLWVLRDPAKVLFILLASLKIFWVHFELFRLIPTLWNFFAAPSPSQLWLDISLPPFLVLCIFHFKVRSISAISGQNHI